MSHITNKYFIVQQADLANYTSYTVDESPRLSIDGTQAVIKLPFNQHNIPQVFSRLVCYNHTDILVQMATEEWKSNEI